MEMLKLVILLSLGLLGASQVNPPSPSDQCPLNDDQVELIQRDQSIVPPKGYDINSARRALTAERQKQLADDVKAADSLASVAFDKSIDILIPAPIKADPLCESKFKKLWIGNTIWFNGGVCYVLKPWWNTVFTTITYATCPRQKCKNLTWTTWLSPYRWWCVPANYKTFYIWVYCPGSKMPYKSLPLHLPQCCECRRYRVFFQFPVDFAEDLSAGGV